jgi:hypothetical protein
MYVQDRCLGAAIIEKALAHGPRKQAYQASDANE